MENDRVARRERERERERRIPAYDVLRVALTLLVVIGHSTYCTISTPYGGCDYSLYFISPSVLYSGVILLTRLIYVFHMPLFMMLSGALFFETLRGNKYGTVAAMIRDKAKRLLFPFAVVITLYSFPIKYLSGYYSASSNIAVDFFLGQFLIQGNTHLWFLVALFFVEVIVFLVERCWKGRQVVKLLGLYVLYGMSRFVPIIVVSKTMEMLLWFYIGYCFEPNREKLSGKRPIRTMLLCALIFLLLCMIKPRIDNKILRSAVVIPLSVLLGSYSVYLMSQALSMTELVKNPLYRLLLRDSYGIYLYADPLNYLILSTWFSAFGEVIFTEELPSLALYLFRIFFTLFAAVGVTEALRKARVKYLC